MIYLSYLSEVCVGLSVNLIGPPIKHRVLVF